MRNKPGRSETWRRLRSLSIPSPSPSFHIGNWIWRRTRSEHVTYRKPRFLCATVSFSLAAATPVGTEPVNLILDALFYSFFNVSPDRTLPPIWLEGHSGD